MITSSSAVLIETGPDAGQPWHFGDPLREQRRLEAGDGAVDLSHRGVITVTGPDRLGWLHSLTSQHLDGLAPGVGVTTLVLSPQGHIEHALYGVDDGETFWAHTEPGAAAAAAAWLDRMRFMMRVEVADRTDGVRAWSGSRVAAGGRAADPDRAGLPGRPRDLRAARRAGSRSWPRRLRPGCGRTRPVGSPPGCRGSGSTPITGPSPTSSGCSARRCTWTRAATAARRRSPGCTTWAVRPAGWSGCTWTARSTRSRRSAPR